MRVLPPDLGFAKNCSSKCGNPGYKGDKRCDDDNNNCGCGWDGGDCCGQNGDKWQRAYCTACECLDAKDKSFNSDSKCPGKKQCGMQGFVGDGRCDDKNNNCGCGWDKGDCCGYSGDKLQWSYCTVCECLDLGFKEKHKCPNHKNGCKLAIYVGDSRCDDLNNNCNCGWDGGDCCDVTGDTSQFEYCEKCKCLNPGYKPQNRCEGKCKHADWKGDGNCDDKNNLCGCDWDGELDLMSRCRSGQS